MTLLPKEIKLTLHAQQRLLERKGDINLYNTKNLMKSSVKWYGKDDLIPESNLYIHCLYVCRKAKNKMGYLTDGNIEVLYDKNAHVAITILEVKDKFKPITQYIKPEYLKQTKKEQKKEMNKIEVCPDCGKKNVEITPQGICIKCKTRKINYKYRNKEYIPYVDLSEKEKNKIDKLIIGQAKRRQSNNHQETIVPICENSMKNPLLNESDFIANLREYGCKIPETNLKKILNVLIATDKLKDAFLTVAENDNQNAILDLEQALIVVEKKLQCNWEYNGFQEADDIKFKDFLTWRRSLRGAIFFWKKLYQTNAIVEMQKVWNAYTANPNDKQLLAGDRMNSTQKRYQITTESISTILNTRKAFTRVFYATSKKDAYDKFTKWMTEHQLHENKTKTTIIELNSEGENEKK